MRQIKEKRIIPLLKLFKFFLTQAKSKGKNIDDVIHILNNTLQILEADTMRFNPFKKKTPFDKTFGRKKLNFSVEQVIDWGERKLKEYKKGSLDHRFHKFINLCLLDNLRGNKLKGSNKLIFMATHGNNVKHYFKELKLSYKEIKNNYKDLFNEIKKKLKDQDTKPTIEDYYYLTGQRYAELMKFLRI